MVELICEICQRRTEHLLLGNSGKVKAACSFCGYTKYVLLVKTSVARKKTTFTE